jgi:preprotein translocase subunit SecA
MNQQREVIYGLRRELMQEPDMEAVLDGFLADLLDDVYAPLEEAKGEPPAETRSQAVMRLLDICNLSRALPDFGPESDLPDRETARVAVTGIFAMLREEAGAIYADILRFFLLEELDRCWKEHLRSMDYLREGIGLRGYGQRDPKLEYKREGFEMFQAMLFRIREGAVRSLTRVRVQKPAEEAAEPPAEFRHKAALPSGGSRPQGPAAKPGNHRMEAERPKVGRNDPCPCGSGKKYKKCCGANG